MKFNHAGRQVIAPFFLSNTLPHRNKQTQTHKWILDGIIRENPLFHWITELENIKKYKRPMHTPTSVTTKGDFIVDALRFHPKLPTLMLS